MVEAMANGSDMNLTMIKKLSKWVDYAIAGKEYEVLVNIGLAFVFDPADNGRDFKTVDVPLSMGCLQNMHRP